MWYLFSVIVRFPLPSPFSLVSVDFLRLLTVIVTRTHSQRTHTRVPHLIRVVLPHNNKVFHVTVMEISAKFGKAHVLQRLEARFLLLLLIHRARPITLVLVSHLAVSRVPQRDLLFHRRIPHRATATESPSTRLRSTSTRDRVRGPQLISEQE